jgi:hypothetical protein
VRCDRGAVGNVGEPDNLIDIFRADRVRQIGPFKEVQSCPSFIAVIRAFTQLRVISVSTERPLELRQASVSGSFTLGRRIKGSGGQVK